MKHFRTLVYWRSGSIMQIVVKLETFNSNSIDNLQESTIDMTSDLESIIVNLFGFF
jgi:hypothetical protein